LRLASSALLSLEQIVQAHAQKKKLSQTLMYRISLPQDQACELLRWLSYEDITGALMFPGRDGEDFGSHSREIDHCPLPPDTPGSHDTPPVMHPRCTRARAGSAAKKLSCVFTALSRRRPELGGA
jgi:hypothetical protein